MNDASCNFVKWKMTSWEEAVSLANLLPENWIFRGQENSLWGLTTSLERYHNAGNGAELWRQKDAEDKMLEMIKRKGHLVLSETPKTYDDIDWLAILQHHGAATHLLDSTESFYVATYFAVEKLKTDAVIWAIDKRYLGNYLIKQAIENKFNEEIKLHAEQMQNNTDVNLVDKLARHVAKYIFRCDPCKTLKIK